MGDDSKEGGFRKVDSKSYQMSTQTDTSRGSLGLGIRSSACFVISHMTTLSY